MLPQPFLKQTLVLISCFVFIRHKELALALVSAHVIASTVKNPALHYDLVDPSFSFKKL